MNSEQVSLESFAEAVEQLCGPDIGRELVPPLHCQPITHKNKFVFEVENGSGLRYEYSHDFSFLSDVMFLLTEPPLPLGVQFNFLLA